MVKTAEFQEIGHSGGKFKVTIKTDKDGKRSMQCGFSGSRPVRTCLTGVYALPQGIPVGMISLGGIGQKWNSPPFPGCYPIFISSDSQGKFGFECPKCSSYWRSVGHSATTNKCPYCGLVAQGFNFLTSGQVRYVEACCEMIGNALAELENGEAEVNMDEVADLVGKDTEKPTFYYHDESQQNKFSCQSCGAFNDILGRFGYCCVCGTHNGLDEFSNDIKRIRTTLDGSAFSSAAKEIVASFDSLAGCLSKQLSDGVAMTKRRRSSLKNRRFHNLKKSADVLKSIFDIDILNGMSSADIRFLELMFHRRHVYEHNGGEVDQKYIDDSGDTSVRLKQVIRESNESIQKLADLSLKLAENLSDGFHDIFSPNDGPIDFHKKCNQAK